ncbi:MAG: hypothetical protein NTV79_00215 [Candidatus Aureabacteria bacterium]|nr:hypothetical protein [Candidatus Auribacterota bacterium]
MSAINEMLIKGIAPPTFEEITGAAVVTFRGNVFGPRHETAQVAPQVTPQVARVLGAASSACSFAELQAAAGLKDRVHFLRTHLELLLFVGWIERTIPDKPRSSKQNHRLTEKSRKVPCDGTGGK